MQILKSNPQKIITREVNFKVELNPIYHNRVYIGRNAVDQINRFGRIVKTLGVVGKNYKPIDHKVQLTRLGDVVETLTKGKFEVKHTIQDREHLGRKILSQFLLKSDNFAFNGSIKNELSYPSLTMINSFDGSSSFQIIMGIVRMICSNGMTVINKKLTAIKNKHFQSFDVKRSIEELPGLIEQYSYVYGDFSNRAMVKRPMAHEKIDELIKGKPFAQKMVKEAFVQFEHENRNDAWGQYNAFTNRITRAELSPDKKEEHLRVITAIFQTYVGMNV